MNVPAGRSRALALCLVTAATVLGGMFHVHGQVIRAKRAIALVRATQRVDAVEAAESAAAAVRTTSAPRAPEASERDGVPAVAVIEAAGDEAPTLVRLPKLVGLRLTYASHRASRRGLLVEARDERGELVDLVFAPSYRVVRQQLRHGVLLQPGHVIEVEVRERAPAYGEGC